MKENKKNLWKLVAAFVGGAAITALLFVATNGGLLEGKLFKTPVKDTGFSVEIQPVKINMNQPGLNYYYQGKDGVITVKVGDTFDFKKIAYNPSKFDYAWSWNWEMDNGFLKCSPYPEFDSDTLRCTALKIGSPFVSYSAYPVFTAGPYTGSQGSNTSNLITVKIQAATASTAADVSNVNQYTVNITSNPAATTTNPDIGLLNAKEGQKITFTKKITSNGVANTSFSWKVTDPTVLKCAAIPFDGPNFVCTVNKGTKGKSTMVYYETDVKYTDGQSAGMGSNIIQVDVK